MTPRGMRFPPFVMDRPTLQPLADVLADSERARRVRVRVASTPARASPSLRCRCCSRRSIARLGRSLLCLLPDDEDARDAAEAAAWFAGADSVAFMPGRGVTPESGLRMPPHLVGERLRALSVLADGGLVCMSCSRRGGGAAFARGAAAADRDGRRRRGRARGVDRSSSSSPATSASSASRSVARSPFAAEFSTSTGRRAASRFASSSSATWSRASAAFSAFTQRALLRPRAARSIFPASERRADLPTTAHGDDGRAP